MEEDPTASVADMLQKLSIATEEERKSLLSKARPFLLAPDAGTKYKKYLENGDFSVIFDCLNSADKHVVQATCEILSRIFEFINPNVVLDKYSDFLNRCLTHPNHSVKEVILGVMNKSLGDNPEVEGELLRHQSLTVKGVKCLVDEELSVSKHSHKLIKKMANIRSRNNQIYIFIEPILSVLKEMLDTKTDSLKLRVLELFVDICCISHEHTERIAKEGFLKGLFDDLKKDEDVLVQLNAIEIVSNLAETKQGYDYLQSLSILSQMDTRLNEVASGSLAHFLMPGYVKFFGRLAYHNPSRFHDLYPNFFSILVNMLSESSDQDQQLLALEVFGHITLRNEGKKMLIQNSSVHTPVYELLRKNIKSGTSEAKVRALAVFADIIRATSENNSNDECSKELFEKLFGSETMSIITDLAKRPFGDISAGAYDVLMSATVHSWSLQMLLQIGGFFEYLLDRSTAKDKETKDHKYALISSICAQKEVNNLIPGELLKQLRTYVQQGAFYKESTVEVAIEEQ